MARFALHPDPNCWPRGCCPSEPPEWPVFVPSPPPASAVPAPPSPPLVSERNARHRSADNQPSKPRRPHRLFVRLSDDEKRRLDELWGTGRRISENVRASILGGEDNPTPAMMATGRRPTAGEASYYRAVAQLTRIVNLLDQLAKHANTIAARGGTVDAATIIRGLKLTEKFSRAALRADPVDGEDVIQ